MLTLALGVYWFWRQHAASGGGIWLHVTLMLSCQKKNSFQWVQLCCVWSVAAEQTGGTFSWGMCTAKLWCQVAKGYLRTGSLQINAACWLLPHEVPPETCGVWTGEDQHTGPVPCPSVSASSLHLSPCFPEAYVVSGNVALEWASRRISSSINIRDNILVLPHSSKVLHMVCHLYALLICHRIISVGIPKTWAAFLLFDPSGTYCPWIENHCLGIIPFGA